MATSYTITADPTDTDRVIVTESLGTTRRIPREDADPEDRRIVHRLAAAWFGNPFTPQ